jgi:hypothetical protein
MEIRNNSYGQFFRLIIFEIRYLAGRASSQILLSISFNYSIKKFSFKTLFGREQFILRGSAFNIFFMSLAID